MCCLGRSKYYLGPNTALLRFAAQCTLCQNNRVVMDGMQYRCPSCPVVRTDETTFTPASLPDELDAYGAADLANIPFLSRTKIYVIYAGVSTLDARRPPAA